MAHTSTYDVKFRRRLRGKTNYAKRLALVKSGLPRLVVRKSNKYVYAQLIEFKSEGDKVLASVNSRELEKFGWNASKKNVPAGYLTGLLVGLTAKKAKIGKAVLDIGMKRPVHGSVQFSLLKGAVDAGLEMNFDESAVPPKERIEGKHIGDFASKLSSEDFNKIFSDYAKKKVDAKNLPKVFETVKNKILSQ